MFIDLIFSILGILFAAVLAYLYFLALASLWPARRVDGGAPTIKFAVVIPARNESRVIGRTLSSLKAIDYPEHLYDVIVVANNCEDDTAAISRREGALCWERNNHRWRGKSDVLRWAFKRLLEKGDHGAYAVIDADTIVDPNFFKVVNGYMLSGAQVVQGYYDALHPERSPMGSLSYLGFVLSRNFRYSGRTRLGWTTNLLGNGMCFTRDVIERFGWCANSIVEDIEYELILHLNGIRVFFVPEAKIYAEIPDTFQSAKAQRGRWDIGKLRLLKRFLLRLLWEGIRKRDMSYFDSAMELMIPPFSLFVVITLLCFILYMGLNFDVHKLNFVLWTSIIGSLGIYIFGGLARAHASAKIYLNLIYAPYFMLWRLYVVVRESIYGKHRLWVKTERK